MRVCQSRRHSTSTAAAALVATLAFSATACSTTTYLSVENRTPSAVTILSHHAGESAVIRTGRRKSIAHTRGDLTVTAEGGVEQTTFVDILDPKYSAFKGKPVGIFRSSVTWYFTLEPGLALKGHAPALAIHSHGFF